MKCKKKHMARKSFQTKAVVLWWSRGATYITYRNPNLEALSSKSFVFFLQAMTSASGGIRKYAGTPAKSHGTSVLPPDYLPATSDLSGKE
jgi:hypothetical protein